MGSIGDNLHELMGLPESACLSDRKLKYGFIAQVRGVHYDADRI